jgi:hypothetical protein
MKPRRTRGFVFLEIQMRRSSQESNDGWRILDVLALPEGLANELDCEEEQRRRQRREERMAGEREPMSFLTKSNVEASPLWIERFVDWGGLTLKVLSKEDVEQDAAALDC